MPDSAQLRTWLDSGLAAHRRGDIEQAVAAYRQALILAPDDADALNLLGTGLLQLGDAPTALPNLERAARKQRNNPMLLANLAQAYIALQRYGEAAETFRKASRIAPQELHYQLGLATALAMQGKPADAAALLKRLAARFPDSAPVWFNFGNALRDSKEPQEAITAYQKAIALEPGFADAINNLGSAMQSTLRFAEAEEHYRRCLAVAPDHLLARYNLASVVMDLGRFPEAERICRELVERAPNAPTGYTILGAAVGHQGRLLDARACHTHAARLTPDDPKAVENYAAALMETGLAGRGLRWFSRALALSPEADPPRQLLGIELLSHGHLQDGWIEYGRRPAALRFREKYPTLALATSLPNELHGKHVCVLREQGLGDELFFLRYAPVLARRGARITYRASNKIASLLERVPCIEALVEEMAPLPPADANILVGDLPRALGELASSPLDMADRSPATSLPELAYHASVYWPPVPGSLELQPLDTALDAVRERLSKIGPPPYIGVTWRAGTAPEEQNSPTWLLYKSIELNAIGRAMSDVGGTILALQRKPAAGEIDAFATALGRAVHDFTDLNEDLESMLALLALLDDYIAVSNTNVHLRAAVGRTARVLVPAPAEWRWRQSGRSTPWFPGFAIYRQSLQGHWDAALAALKSDLELNYAQAAHSNSA
jgi:tetratricopeptide (TPR) repeat protein